MQALLPLRNVRRDVIENIPEGETVWTVPWAMWVDKERRCWLHPHYHYSSGPGGTVTMQVRRDKRGWHVVITDDTEYDLVDRPTYVAEKDAAAVACIPVATLKVRRTYPDR